MAEPTVFVSCVAFNSGPEILGCLEAVCAQTGYTLGENLVVTVLDNAGTQKIAPLVSRQFGDAINTVISDRNLGFAGGHNRLVKDFLTSNAEYLLIVNPDLRLDRTALSEMIAALGRNPEAGAACAKLYRADTKLNPIEPRTFDSAGMYISPSLRHFDRGSEEIDRGQYERECFVFGATGACALFSRAFVQDVILAAGSEEFDLAAVHPELIANRELRTQLFDEAFFAYREDADLAWRAQLLGWRCVYVPKAVGYHVRLVTPARRSKLSPVINRLGVRNRFLLQLNNFSWRENVAALIPGVIFRNLVVVLAVLLWEWRSLPALRDVWLLRRRAIARRRLVFARRTERGPKFSVGRWFRSAPYTEVRL